MNALCTNTSRTLHSPNGFRDGQCLFSMQLAGFAVFLAFYGLGASSERGWHRPTMSPRPNRQSFGYRVLRRSASEFLRPPSMPICTAVTATITAAVTRCTTASVVLFGKVKT